MVVPLAPFSPGCPGLVQISVIPSFPFSPMCPSLPSTPGTPSFPLMVTASFPSFPLIEMPSLPLIPTSPLSPLTEMPSFPLMPTPDTPSFPLTPITPSLPSAPAFPTMTLSADSSLSSMTSMIVLPLASWLTLVLTFLPEYSLSAFVPSPWIFTVLSSLFRTVAPLLAPKYRPLPSVALLTASFRSPMVAALFFWSSLAFASAVPFSALFTLLIVDPPTFTVPSPSVIVVLLLPAFPFEIEVIPFSALASCTCSFPFTLLTPMLPSVSFVLSAPPTMSIVLLSSLAMTLLLSVCPSSPANFSPSSSPRLSPSLLTVVLTYLSPLTVSGVVELMVFVPFGVFASWITQFTSPLMLLTASFRSPMVAALFFWSSLAFASAVPFSALFTLLIVDPPTFTVPSPSVIVVLLLPAFPFEIDVIPFSALASIILMLVLPLASWLTLVLMFSPEYSLSAFVPSPWIFTVLPSLFRTVAPLLAPKYSPLPLIASLVMLVMFWFSLFSSTLYCTPSVSVTEVRYFPSPLNFTVGVVSLVSVTVFWLPLSAVTPNWALILVIGVVVLLLILVIRSPVIFLTSLFLSIPYVTFLSLRLTVIVSSAVANSIVGVVPSPSLTWLVALPAFRLKPLFRLLMSVLLF